MKEGAFGFRPPGAILLASNSGPPPKNGENPDVSPEDLDQERKASAERRRIQFESLRREKPVTEPTEVRTLSRAQKLKLRDDDFVAPKE